jgi:hypothetical protein
MRREDVGIAILFAISLLLDLFKTVSYIIKESK